MPVIHPEFSHLPCLVPIQWPDTYRAHFPFTGLTIAMPGLIHWPDICHVWIHSLADIAMRGFIHWPDSCHTLTPFTGLTFAMDYYHPLASPLPCLVHPLA
ncbi:hypothetical protein PoB_006925600 [Plakobranchus ocellatus]|uniref:Uncharacterized protein n=1 Tax=Plakobranchus ocellatus TaxID=259542 RepID=A0AAV4DFZ5_9GAST|nr:hypothetical protein PoB_006925600 [Plakobranchus ocellatus]